MKFFIVDAFADRAFAGNPAGVVLLGGLSNPDGGISAGSPFDFIPDETMLAIAAELRYSETAFVVRRGESVFETRYFTPAAEVELCGHATIATFHTLAETGLIMGDGAYTNKTLAGDLMIEIENGTVWMDMAEPKTIGTINEPKALDELYSVMGLCEKGSYPEHKDGDSPDVDCFATLAMTTCSEERSHDTLGVSLCNTVLFPGIVSTGLPDIILPVASCEILDSISPDFSALAELSKRYDVVGVHAFCADKGSTSVFHCRNFAPLYGIDEEAATGTSNGALTYYLYNHGIVKPNGQNIFRQGKAMGRESIISTRLTEDHKSDANEGDSGTIKIQVGGTAVILAQGELNL